MKENSVLLLWCLGRTVLDILYLIAVWGYDYVGILFVWVKLGKGDNMYKGFGYWTRSNVEFIVMAKKGSGR